MRFTSLLCCAAVLSFAVCSMVVAGPKIAFDSESLDLGPVVKGQPITATFTFKNIGDAELDIAAVKAGCGCTKAAAEKNKLAPGESSTITAVFNSAGYKGHVSKSMSVRTNDPDRPRLSLTFKADVVAIATLKPERLNFGSIKVNESRTHLLQVYPGKPQGFEITKTATRGTHTEVPSFKKISADTGDYWELTVLVKAGEKTGRIMEWLDIVTGPGANDKISVLVYGNSVE